MNTLYYSAYIGVIVWAIVPIRQYKEKYFFYFLALVSADIATLLIRYLIHPGINFFYAPFSFFALISLLEFRVLKKYFIVFLLLFLFSCTVFLNINIMIISISIFHLAILLVLLKEFIVSFIKNKFFSVFLVILIFYEITVIAKFMNYLTGFTNDYYYFIITSFFEIAFGIFFIIFKADNKRLIFQFE